MVIMAAIDMHAKSLVCELGYGKRDPKRRTFSNDANGHQQLLTEISNMKEANGLSDALVAYEASGLGYVLYDRIREAAAIRKVGVGRRCRENNHLSNV